MKKLNQLYDGRAKKIFATDDPRVVLMSYKDEASAYGGLKRSSIPGKGAVNNRMTNYLMRMLENNGIHTDYIEEISDRETLLKKVEIIPLKVIVRNLAAGSLTRRLGVPEGQPLKRTVLEYCYRSDELDDPLVNDYHILAMGWATEHQLKQISACALKVNQVLRSYFSSVGIELVDFKLEFGMTPDGEVLLADEISPDSCRLWDKRTHECLDKDRFRLGLGEVAEAYQEVLERVLAGGL